MCAVQLLRVSVQERLGAAVADLLLRLEEGGEAAERPALRALLTERLSAAAEEIVSLLERTVAEYEERLECSERELQSQRRLLDAVLKPQVLLRRADVQQPVKVKQEQEEAQEQQEPPDIKEEPQEAEIGWVSFSSASVKNEEDEEKPQFAHLHPNTDSAGGAGCLKEESESWSDLPSQRLSCSFCGKCFKSGGTLTRHVWVHTGDRLLRCIVCHRSFDQEASLLTHHCAQAASPPRLTYGCSLCHHSFATREELSEHAASHVTCSVCHVAFADTDALVLHMRSHGAQTQFSCSVCGKGFAWRRHLTQHMELHRNKKVHRYSICRRTLCRRRTRLGHRRCIHRPGPAHEHQTEETTAARSPTQLCPEPTPDPDHRMAESLQPQSDDSVDSDFWKEDRKRRSEPTINEGEQLTLEPEPGTPAQIEINVDGSSAGDVAVQKRFACSDCGKSFQYRYLLRRHLRTHTGEKPFRCSVCGKRFSQKENLVYHMGLHTGHKRFSCSVCQRRFNWLSGVKRHICVPEGEDDLGPEPRPGGDCEPQ